MERRKESIRQARAAAAARDLETLDELEAKIADLRPSFAKARHAVAIVVGVALLPAAFGAPRVWVQVAVWTALIMLGVGYLPSWWRYRTLRKRLQDELELLA